MFNVKKFHIFTVKHSNATGINVMQYAISAFDMLWITHVDTNWYCLLLQISVDPEPCKTQITYTDISYSGLFILKSTTSAIQHSTVCNNSLQNYRILMFSHFYCATKLTYCAVGVSLELGLPFVQFWHTSFGLEPSQVWTVSSLCLPQRRKK